MSARLEASGDGAIQTLTVDRPPGNVLDIETCRVIGRLVEEAASAASAKLLVVRGAGKHFSFGASVEEHLPESAEVMLGALGRVVNELQSFPYPTLAAVQGRCLGGGLELALSCGLLFVEEDAVLAAPEIQLGVFAPAATALLAGRIPCALAEEVLLTGRNVSAEEAQRWGLVNRVVPQGGLDQALEAWADEHVRPRSAASLRVATGAWRSSRAVATRERLRGLERRYVDELLPLHDGTEGIRAFLEKRTPQWEDR
jgi:cyclohexa-1,5-dienecarbonyl-CoA hydratase